jgi:hypothetical protein
MTGYDHKDLLTLKKLIKDDGWLMRRLVNLAWVGTTNHGETLEHIDRPTCLHVVQSYL